MSADKKSSEPLFSKKNKKLITDPLTDNNPVTIQVLGICSALAITVQVNQAIVMSMSVLFVIIMGNWIVSMLRNLIPSRIRIIVQLLVVASLVIIVDPKSSLNTATNMSIAPYPRPLPNPSRIEGQGLFAIANASKRPIIIKLVIINPTKTESFADKSGKKAAKT